MSRTVFNKLLTHSYANYQVLHNHLAFHNHTTHHLGSLHFLGASDERLEEIYKVMCETADPYDPSPHEITRTNWRDLLGDRHFCEAYKDFFEQELTASGEKWRDKFLELLLENKTEPMINGVVGGLAHSLIHIGYAFELDSQIAAIEALTQSAVNYDFLHEIIDKLEPPKSGSKSALEIFHDYRSDDQLPLFDSPNIYNLNVCVEKSTDRVLFHYNQWQMNGDNMEKTIEELFDLSVYIYGATHRPDQIAFDFFLLHLLTGMHAIRVIYLHLKNQEVAQHVLLQFFYFASIMYINQLRSEINTKLIDEYKLDDDKNTWDYAIERAVNTKLAEDAHLVKVVHSLRAAEAAYGAKNGLYLKTAVKTVDNVNADDPWVIELDDPRQLNVLKRA